MLNPTTQENFFNAHKNKIEFAQKEDGPRNSLTRWRGYFLN